MTQNHGEESKLEFIADVSEQRVARVYAESLLNAAEKRGQDDTVFHELESLVNEVFKNSPPFEAFLTSSAIGRHHKAEVIDKVFTPRAGELLCNFLLVLNEHERLGLLRPILAAYRDMRDERA